MVVCKRKRNPIMSKLRLLLNTGIQNFFLKRLTLSFLFCSLSRSILSPGICKSHQAFVLVSQGILNGNRCLSLGSTPYVACSAELLSRFELAAVTFQLDNSCVYIYRSLTIESHPIHTKEQITWLQLWSWTLHSHVSILFKTFKLNDDHRCFRIHLHVF